MTTVSVVGTRLRLPVRRGNRVLEYVKERGEEGMSGTRHARKECKKKTLKFL